ncbi:MAG TPA: tetratricopeptide repeat protein [Actinocrinis sp.]|nr:tetratricopeptide repeat protein [Actinocrinis sp.]
MNGEAGPIEIPSQMPRTILAELLLHANTVVSADALIDILWHKNPPATANASFHNHIMRMRRLLGPEGAARIRSVAPGFLIEVRPGELDLDTFADLHTAGTLALQESSWEKASELLTTALALWRGDPGADVPGFAARPEVRHLLDAKLDALAGRIEADLELGRHAEVISELQALTAAHPTHQVFHQQLMLALYRSGRQAEALDAFQTLNLNLNQSLHPTPAENPPATLSAEVQDLHHRILNADPALAPPPVKTPGQTGPRFQLPADTRVFTGRSQELADLLALARIAPIGTEAGMVVISAIDGMAGIGKTALAVHSAHHLREQFPDGQLFVNLHGYAADREPLTPGDALDTVLRSLGAAPQSIPADLGERAAFYRGQLDGTRTLLILDNASSAAQVRPLLPGSPGCLVLVTSRKRLTGLDDAHLLALGVLPAPDAVVLLHKVAGPDRIPAHHPAILDLVELCGRVPLAIRIMAARLRRHPQLRIEDVVRQLSSGGARLEVFQDEVSNLAAVFDLSYRDLAADEQRLFRRLAVVPGPDFDAYAAACLAGTGPQVAERVLESLLDHNLLIQRAPGRYQFHDLIRLHAAALDNDNDNEPTTNPDHPLERLLDYYQHTARSANDRLIGFRQVHPAPSAVATTPTHAPRISGREEALTWMRAERENLLAAVTLTCADPAHRARAIDLIDAMGAFLRQDGPWPQVTSLHQSAILLARESGDRLGEANALGDLGRLRYLTGDDVASVGLQDQALALYRGLGNRSGEACTLQDLGRARLMTGDLHGSAELHEQALTIFRELGNQSGEANAVYDLGRVRYSTSDHQIAAELFDQAQHMFRNVGDRLGQANTLHDLGHARCITGDYPGAAAAFGESLAAYRDFGSRHGEANALAGQGHVGNLIGDYSGAAELYEQALTLYQELGNRHAEAKARQELGRIAYETGDHQGAETMYQQSLASFQELGSRHAAASVVLDLGRVRHATGKTAAAAELVKESLESFQELGDRQGEADALTCTGALLADTAEPQAALIAYRRALEIAREVHSPLDAAHALEGAGRCSVRIGDLDTALADLGEAVAIYQRLGAAEAQKAADYLAGLTA